MDFESVIVAVGVAIYAALMLGYFVHDDLGYSCAQIRDVAMIAAGLLAIPVAKDILRSGLDKAR